MYVLLRNIITGGAGFIGSHIAETLAPDHDVVVSDDLCGYNEYPGYTCEIRRREHHRSPPPEKAF
jgi:nucleoside-diphosphate-sugar epimerase